VTNLCDPITGGNQEFCPAAGVYNQHGYLAHFDMAQSSLFSSLGWNNPVVTYQVVPCGGGQSPTTSDWLTCQCAIPGDHLAQMPDNTANHDASSNDAPHATAATSTAHLNTQAIIAICVVVGSVACLTIVAVVVVRRVRRIRATHDPRLDSLLSNVEMAHVEYVRSPDN